MAPAPSMEHVAIAMAARPSCEAEPPMRPASGILRQWRGPHRLGGGVAHLAWAGEERQRRQPLRPPRGSPRRYPADNTLCTAEAAQATPAGTWSGSRSARSTCGGGSISATAPCMAAASEGDVMLCLRNGAARQCDGRRPPPRARPCMPPRSSSTHGGRAGTEHRVGGRNPHHRHGVFAAPGRLACPPGLPDEGGDAGNDPTSTRLTITGPGGVPICQIHEILQAS